MGWGDGGNPAKPPDAYDLGSSSTDHILLANLLGLSCLCVAFWAGCVSVAFSAQVNCLLILIACFLLQPCGTQQFDQSMSAHGRPGKGGMPPEDLGDTIDSFHGALTSFAKAIHF